MWIINKTKTWFLTSIILIVLSVGSIIYFGFNWGIDFVGGSITEVSYEVRPDVEIMRSTIEGLGLGGVVVRPTGDKNIIVKTKSLGEVEKASLLSALSQDGKNKNELIRYNAVGPSVGQELRSKAIWAISIVMIAIVLFIIFAFRKVSEPVPSWKYGIATIVALFHDLLIPTGAYVILGHFVGYEIDLLFVAALLAVMGYSVHDTIVVFDRVRENLRKNIEFGEKEDFEVTVGHGLMQTMGRSINTSLTTLFALIALFVLGGDSTRGFTAVLMVGVLVGAYSSIFLASPLLVWFNRKVK